MKKKCDICKHKFSISSLYIVSMEENEEKIVCEECMEEKDLWDYDYYPLEEDYEYMDEEEQEGWDSIIEHWNKD